MKKIIFVIFLGSTFCWSQKQIEVSTIKEKVENTKCVFRLFKSYFGLQFR